MKEALIIGGTGLLGRGVTLELIQSGWSVTILSRGQKALPPELGNCRNIVADRGQAGALQEASQDEDYDLVVDCAAYNRLDAEEAVRTFSGKAKHYWFISTDFVYAADPKARFPIKETAATQTAPSYAAGKLEAESYLLETAHLNNFPVTILRPPHILGAGRPAGCDPAAGGRDPNLVKRIQNGDTLSLLGGGHLLIQPIWSREVGRCIDQLFQNPNTFGKCFNIAGAECVTTLEYYQIIADLFETELYIEAVDIEQFRQQSPKQAHIARHRIYDLSALHTIGFTPTLLLKDALKSTFPQYSHSHESKH